MQSINPEKHIEDQRQSDIGICQTDVSPSLEHLSP